MYQEKYDHVKKPHSMRANVVAAKTADFSIVIKLVFEFIKIVRKMINCLI